MNIGNKDLFNRVIYNNKTVPNSFDMSVAGADIVFMAWTGFFYFFLVFVVEKLN